ncbi:Duplicated ATPase component MtsB of energizingmodule of methionine-regulated ECF transporter [Streptococcus sp. HSISB1]|nr:Duplicated ATPase component MtsB of energizingmodule of methionine-regulated ECF transporter [Streptococcus sp. HSISB1]
MTKAEHLSDINQLDLSDITVKGLSQSSDVVQKENILEANHLEFSYDDGKKILNDISFAVHKGERIAIVGKNGAGKSTLAKALCQFIRPDGEILYQGNSIMSDSIKERAEKIGYVLQNPNQMISQTMIFDEVALGLRLRGLSEQEIEQRVLETLKVCGLYEFRNWPISALSFGQKKRVTIASVLVMNPEIILLDEPTAGQDKKHYTEIMTFLNQLNKAGHTIIMITHDMQLMLEYSDRSIVISDGEIIADCTPVDLFSQVDILDRANLKKTSLFDLAEKLGINPIDLTHYYIKQQGGCRG